MPIPPDFASESLYAPSSWFVHDVIEIVPAEHRIVAVLETERLRALVADQVAWPGHEPHVPAAVVVQMTGTLGNLHAVYVLGLRPSEGWIGFGTGIREARFPAMGKIGPRVVAHAHATRSRNVGGNWFVEYTFRFEQEGEDIYRARHSAVWLRSRASP